MTQQGRVLTAQNPERYLQRVQGEVSPQMVSDDDRGCQPTMRRVQTFCMNADYSQPE